MPAHRSRTERWRECLQQIYERGGGIEFSIDRCKVPASGEAGHDMCIPDLMWRVRVIGLSETEILVENPGAAGASLPFADDCGVIGVLAVGQNRWMFHSKLLGPNDGPSPWGGNVSGLRLAMPTKVERCHRRDFTRVSTAELHLPKVECWQLLNPMSIGPAEAANRVSIHALQSGTGTAGSTLLPDVGPAFGAQLLNIGVGGVGLIFSKEEASAADRARMMWLRLDLRPVIAAPIALTARVVHKHIDSSQNLIVGAAFDFSFNQSHRDFVVEQIVRYVNTIMPQAKAA